MANTNARFIAQCVSYAIPRFPVANTVFTVKTFVFDLLSLLKYFINVQFSILSFTEICGQFYTFFCYIFHCLVRYPLLSEGFAFAKYFNVCNKMERLSSNCLYCFNPSKRTTPIIVAWTEARLGLSF